MLGQQSQAKPMLSCSMLHAILAPSLGQIGEAHQSRVARHLGMGNRRGKGQAGSSPIEAAARDEDREDELASCRKAAAVL